MESFDDFEMKPLTSGLGFHKKAVKLSEKVEETGALKERIEANLPAPPPDEMLTDSVKSDRDTLDELLKALGPLDQTFEPSGKDRDVKVSSTLPRQGDSPKASRQEAAPVTDMVTPESIRPPVFDENYEIEPVQPTKPIVHPVSDKTQRGATNSPKPRLTATPISLSAIVLDGVVALAFSLMFLIALLMVTGINLLTVMMNSQTDLTTQISLGILFVAVLQMYVVLSRSFFGKTIAEWTFDLQMGTDLEQGRAMYPIKVVWRSFLTVVTGVFVVPTLSFILRRDLMSYLTGLQLYKRND